MFLAPIPRNSAIYSDSEKLGESASSFFPEFLFEGRKTAKDGAYAGVGLW